MAALPPAGELAVRVDGVRVEGRRADVSGAVTNLGDAGRLAAALLAAGLTVSPPRTGRSGREVTFDLTLTRPADDATPDDGGEDR